MGDLERAGGVPAILKRLKDQLSDEDTVSGKTIYEIADEARVKDEEVIRPDGPAVPPAGRHRRAVSATSPPKARSSSRPRSARR